MNESTVYVLLNEQNYIIRIEGQYTLPNDLSDWVLIESGESCDRLNLAQTHYLPNSLYANDNYRYMYDNGKIIDTVTNLEVSWD